MRRLATNLAWGVLLAGLAGMGLYVGLLVQRKVSPPVVAIDRANRLPGYSTGDAVLLRQVTTGDIAVDDIVAVHKGGNTYVGVVRRVTQDGIVTEYGIAGAGTGPLVVTNEGIIGRADRRVPAAGWLLLAARQPVFQILAGALVVAFVVLLVLGRPTPLAFLEEDLEPIEIAHQPLALPSGPRVPRVTAAPTMAYVERPMSITPDDLRQVRFAQTRKGYDTEAVDRALDTVADSIESLLQERQQLIDRLRNLETEVDRFKAMEGQLGQSLAQAEHSAEQVKADAQAEAQRILAQAKASGGALGPGPQDGTMVELLGETRAIRSLLQAVLTQGGQLGPPPQH